MKDAAGNPLLSDATLLGRSTMQQQLFAFLLERLQLPNPAFITTGVIFNG